MKIIFFFLTKSLTDKRSSKVTHNSALIYIFAGNFKLDFGNEKNKFYILIYTLHSICCFFTRKTSQKYHIDDS